MLNAILDISVIENCHHFDLYNIQVYAVTFNDYGFCGITTGAKLFAEGHSFDCIRLVSANVSITMMQGDNGNIKVNFSVHFIY